MERKYTEKRKQANQAWDKVNLDRISLAVPRGGKDRIKAAADAAGQSVNGYIQSAIDAAITGQPMQATGAPSQQQQAPTATAIPPELMHKAQQAAERVNMTLADWLTMAIDKRIDMDRRTALLQALTPPPSKAQADQPKPPTT